MAGIPNDEADKDSVTKRKDSAAVSKERKEKSSDLFNGYVWNVYVNSTIGDNSIFITYRRAMRILNLTEGNQCIFRNEMFSKEIFCNFYQLRKKITVIHQFKKITQWNYKEFVKCKMLEKNCNQMINNVWLNGRYMCRINQKFCKPEGKVSINLYFRTSKSIFSESDDLRNGENVDVINGESDDVMNFKSVIEYNNLVKNSSRRSLRVVEFNSLTSLKGSKFKSKLKLVVSDLHERESNNRYLCKITQKFFKSEGKVGINPCFRTSNSRISENIYVRKGENVYVRTGENIDVRNGENVDVRNGKSDNVRNFKSVIEYNNLVKNSSRRSLQRFAEFNSLNSLKGSKFKSKLMLVVLDLHERESNNRYLCKITQKFRKSEGKVGINPCFRTSNSRISENIEIRYGENFDVRNSENVGVGIRESDGVTNFKCLVGYGENVEKSNCQSKLCDVITCESKGDSIKDYLQLTESKIYIENKKIAKVNKSIAFDNDRMESLNKEQLLLADSHLIENQVTILDKIYHNQVNQRDESIRDKTEVHVMNIQCFTPNGKTEINNKFVTK